MPSGKDECDVAALVRQHLAPVLTPLITDCTPADYEQAWISISDPDDSRLGPLGITLIGKGTSVHLRRVDRSLGRVTINNLNARRLDVVIDNSAWTGRLIANVRAQAEDSLVVFNLAGGGVINLSDVLLRSARQVLFWGAGATAVGFQVLAIEGEARYVAIGDDVMVSSGVSLRNYDMHAIVDLRTMRPLNGPVDVRVEQHVWVGQDALLLGCERVGFGTIIGAKSIAKGRLPARVIAAGTPARIAAVDRSWGRQPGGISPVEIALLARLEELERGGAV